jgi:hypothetical protein
MLDINEVGAWIEYHDRTSIPRLQVLFILSSISEFDLVYS